MIGYTIFIEVYIIHVILTCLISISYVLGIANTILSIFIAMKMVEPDIQCRQF